MQKISCYNNCMGVKLVMPAEQSDEEVKIPDSKRDLMELDRELGPVYGHDPSSLAEAYNIPHFVEIKIEDIPGQEKALSAISDYCYSVAEIYTAKVIHFISTCKDFVPDDPSKKLITDYLEKHLIVPSIQLLSGSHAKEFIEKVGLSNDLRDDDFVIAVRLQDNLEDGLSVKLKQVVGTGTGAQDELIRLYLNLIPDTLAEAEEAVEGLNFRSTYYQMFNDKSTGPKWHSVKIVRSKTLEEMLQEAKEAGNAPEPDPEPELA